MILALVFVLVLVLEGLVLVLVLVGLVLVLVLVLESSVLVNITGYECQRLYHKELTTSDGR